MGRPGNLTDVAESPAARLGFLTIIERITPNRVVTLSIAIWLLIFLILPMAPVMPANTDPYLMLFASIAALYLGINIFAFSRRPKLRRRPSLRLIQSGFRLMLVLGAMGVGARLIDWFLFRQVDVSASIFENRERLATIGSSGFGTIAAGLLPFTIGAVVLALWARANRIPLRGATLAYALAFVLPALNVGLGSRSVVVLFACIVLATFLLTLPQVRTWHIVSAVFGTIFLLVVSYVMFDMRIQGMNLGPEFIVRYSRYTELVPLDVWFLDIIDRSHRYISNFFFFLSHIGQYYVHGVYEYLYLVDVKRENFLMGNYQFFIFSKFYALLAGDVITLIRELANASPRLGVFTTLFGPAYIDFGYWSPLFIFCMGAIVALTRRAVLSGNPFALPFYAVVLVQLGLTMTHSGISMAGGIFYNIALGGFWLGMTFGPALFVPQPDAGLRQPHAHQDQQAPLPSSG